MTDESAQRSESTPPAADPQSVEGLFLTALGKASAQEREQFLDEACGEDAERRMRIEALLRAYEDAGSFLEKPPAGTAGEATVNLDFLTPSDDPGLLGKLGEYEVYEMLGRGGMGIVFRARDPKLNRVVAIKVLAPELAANPNARRRFLREAQAAAAISHPHVVTIHAVDEGSAAPAASGGRQSPDGGNPSQAIPLSGGSHPPLALPYLVMECIVGQTMQQKLDKQGSLRLTETLRIGHQTAQGLAAAHKQGLIHRDIKPANILLENGVERVKITDFGLARAADDVSITRTGEVSGTPQYMSPEQASGDTVDHRSDLFSLGCVLYAMCTGRSPFRATTLAAAIRRVCDDTPRPIQEINPEVPTWLIEIVNQLLAKNPDERIQSAEEVESLLGEHLAGIQLPARRTAPSPSAPVKSPSVEEHVSPQTAEQGDARSMPEWLLTPMPGLRAVGKVIALAGVGFLLFAFARLIQLDEEWGIALTIAAGVLGLIYYIYDRWGGSRPVFRLWQWALAIGVVFVGLMGGAPRGMLWYTDAPTEFVITMALLGQLLVVVGLIAFAAGNGDAEQPQRSRDRLGAALIGSGLFVWVTTALYAMLLGPTQLPPLAAEYRDLGGPLMMALVILGGVLFGLGMWLQRRVVTPGLVRQLAQSVESSPRSHRPTAETTSPPRTGWPGIVLGVLGLMVLMPLAMFVAYLATGGDDDGIILALLTGGGLIVVGVLIAVIWRISESTSRRLAGVGTGIAVLLAACFGLWRWYEYEAYAPNPPLILTVPPGVEVQEVTINGTQTARVSAANEIIVHHRIETGWPAKVKVVTRDGVIYEYQYTTKPGETKTLRVDGEHMTSIEGALGIIEITFAGKPPFAWVKRENGSSRIGESPYRIAVRPGRTDLWFVRHPRTNEDGFFISRRVKAGETIRFDLDEAVAGRSIPAQEIVGGGELEWDHSMSAVPQGAVLLSIADEGMNVRFEQVHEEAAGGSGFSDGGGGDMSGYSGVPFIISHGAMDSGFGMGGGGMGAWQEHFDGATVKLPEGVFKVHVTDYLAGWGRWGETGSVPLASTTLPDTIEVIAGEFQSLTVSRDLKRVAALTPDWDRLGFFPFRWNNETYDLSRPQAFVVQRLLEAYAAGKSEVEESLLVDVSESGPDAESVETSVGPQAPNLATIFNDGQHPAWGELIVRGEHEDTYRLAKLQVKPTAASSTPTLAVIDLSIADTGLRAFLEPQGLTSGKEHARRWLSTGKSLGVPPGTYRVIVQDEFAGWRTRTKYGEPDIVQYEFAELNLYPGENAELKIDRNFYKMGAAFSRVGPVGGGERLFLWNGETYSLDQNQALAVMRLLKTVADGSLDVHEGRLLSPVIVTPNGLEKQPMSDDKAEATRVQYAESGNTLKGWFGDGQHPAWGTLVIEGEQPHTYRLADLNDESPRPPPSDDEEGATTNAGTPAPVVIGALTPGERDRAGQITIDIRDDGFLVAVRRLSAFDGALSGSEQQVTEYGTTHLRVHPGEYDVLIRDLFFGWGDESQSVTVGTADPPVIVVERKLSRYAKRRDGTDTFLWDGRRYDVSPRYGRYLVNRLLRAFAEGQPDVGEEVLLQELLAERDKEQKGLPELFDVQPYRDEPLEDLAPDFFPAALGATNDAWGSLIVPGEANGTYRLSPLDLGTLKIEGFDEGMEVYVRPLKKDRLFSHRWLSEDGELKLPPGEYHCRVSDQFVGWRRWGNSFGGSWAPSAIAREESVTVRHGESTSVEVRRRLSDYVNPPEPEGDDPLITFTWFPNQRQSDFGSEFGGELMRPRDGMVTLNRTQFRIVLALLEAFTAGQPEMTEEELLATSDSGAEVLSEIFPVDARGPGEWWQSIIVRGETASTWRLKPPPDAGSNIPRDGSK